MCHLCSLQPGKGNQLYIQDTILLDKFINDPYDGSGKVR